MPYSDFVEVRFIIAVISIAHYLIIRPFIDLLVRATRCRFRFNNE